MAKIENSIDYVLQNEGRSKYTNTPGDPGGPTKWGVTWRALAQYRHKAVTADDVKNLTLGEATSVYKHDYWDACGLDEYRDQSCATVVFDCAVNRGVGVAHAYVKYVCAALRKANVNECDPHQFIRSFESRSESGYQAIVASKPSMWKFLKGWLNRAKRMLTLK